jgi:hypothetical protein
MADTPFAPGPVATEVTAQQRRDLIVEAALSYMEHQDWYCAEEDDDPEVVADLQRLYRPDLHPTPCSGSHLFDTGVTLALLWWEEWRAAYERALPAWSCDCGAVYKREFWAAQHEVIYTVTPDGLFDELVASTKGKRGIGSVPRDAYAMNNSGCPSCGRAFKATIARQTDPQTSLIL